MSIEIHTRCRNCDNCRKVRANLWRFRAKAEWACAARTWLGTLTLRPDQHYRALMSARHKVTRQGLDFDALSEAERFGLIHNEISPEITKLLKRLRENSKAPLRYMIVTELHKSGLPHFHVLLHEVRADKPIRYQQLASEWPLGFSKWKLVTDRNGAAYVSKYLTKSLLRARVRASQKYGQGYTLSEHSFNPEKYGLNVESMTPSSPSALGGVGGLKPPNRGERD